MGEGSSWTTSSREREGSEAALRAEVAPLASADEPDEDVRALDNYLACSLSTRSELVVLIRDNNKIVGQFDVDSDAVGAFSEADASLLEEVAGMVAPRVAALTEERKRTA